ncbi:unnamed protein product, partial [marine sediment metagenome]
QTGPQTWTMAAQVISVGMEYARIPYPYDPPVVGDPNQVEGMTYPDLKLDNEQPGTLESCELSEDGLTATWKIRPGVVSPYGNELTSDDILWGVERSLALGGIGAFFLQAGNANDLEKWTVVDKYTVEIKSDTPMAMINKINAFRVTSILSSLKVSFNRIATCSNTGLPSEYEIGKSNPSE